MRELRGPSVTGSFGMGIAGGTTGRCWGVMFTDVEYTSMRARGHMPVAGARGVDECLDTAGLTGRVGLRRPARQLGTA